MMIRDFFEKNKGKRTFLEHEVKGLLKNLGLSVPRGVFIPKETPLSALGSFASGEPARGGQLSALSYPMAAKVSSSKITSKTDAKGIRLGIKNEDELKNAVNELSGIENAEGVLVEEMVPEGLEVIVGGIIDKQFGPVMMFGLGGVFVELYKDVAFALAPMKEKDALWLIQQIKGYKLIEGYRGKPAVDKDALIKAIIAVSEIMAAGNIEEIDLNPVSLYPKGAIVLDAKMSVRSKEK
ncbi:MAG: acetate--CoA ligase family protein [Thermodesulfovibrionales bacterium]|nr:acetate--CoA ligase family protein [Thermodesulfovibrionales bacterium]